MANSQLNKSSEDHGHKSSLINQILSLVKDEVISLPELKVFIEQVLEGEKEDMDKPHSPTSFEASDYLDIDEEMQAPEIFEYIEEKTDTYEISNTENLEFGLVDHVADNPLISEVIEQIELTKSLNRKIAMDKNKMTTNEDTDFNDFESARPQELSSGENSEKCLDLELKFCNSETDTVIENVPKEIQREMCDENKDLVKDETEDSISDAKNSEDIMKDIPNEMSGVKEAENTILNESLTCDSSCLNSHISSFEKKVQEIYSNDDQEHVGLDADNHIDSHQDLHLGGLVDSHDKDQSEMDSSLIDQSNEQVDDGMIEGFKSSLNDDQDKGPSEENPSQGLMEPMNDVYLVGKSHEWGLQNESCDGRNKRKLFTSSNQVDPTSDVPFDVTVENCFEDDSLGSELGLGPSDIHEQSNIRKQRNRVRPLKGIIHSKGNPSYNEEPQDAGNDYFLTLMSYMDLIFLFLIVLIVFVNKNWPSTSTWFEEDDEGLIIKTDEPSFQIQ